MRLPVSAITPMTSVGGRLPLNIAHRGASSQEPENTLAAVRRAVACGADMVEVDVQRTRDGALVVLHDTTLCRTTDVRQVFPGRGPWRVADFTHDELMRLEAGRADDDEPQRIPTLSEVVETLRDGPAGLLLELKAPELYPGIVGDVATSLRDTPGYLTSALPARRLVVQSFNVATMKEFKTQLPEVPVGLLGTPARAHLPVLATWADQVNPHVRAVTSAYVDRVHELGMDCLVWTVDRRQAMRRLVRMGVDGVITNRPHVLAGLVRDRAGAGAC